MDGALTSLNRPFSRSITAMHCHLLGAKAKVKEGTTQFKSKHTLRLRYKLELTSETQHRGRHLP
jgi:hypothetical protein